MGSNFPLRNESMNERIIVMIIALLDFISAVQDMIHFIYHLVH